MESMKNLIYELRGEKVILDFNLARLYGVPTKILKQSVRRNKERFPNDFMFILNNSELLKLRAQNTVDPRVLKEIAPMAFTESGVAMLSSVLNSKKAIEINILIIRIFVSLRKSITTEHHHSLKITAIEDELNKHSEQLSVLFDLLDKLSKDNNKSTKKNWI